ncbi:NAD(P)-dependent oxidoreductase [Paenibacillus agricola]|uniref:NAD(P)-dependent oxidoreductase n=1 Tax=Paenibacillus agricola TaxID=2716264 RepID=A0ABX0JB73_9BACL|nr:NAD(P)-dependent oxidoreductase [Paenibacillus agricola]NHN32521.1 NAD(P)-dependent oxidoreductase [Paenibacillus agricola]
MNSIKQAAAIGFIGTGVMGKSMVKNLIKAGYKLHVYSRTKSKADELLEIGAVWHDTPAELAREVDAVITMVGYPSDVEEIYLGEKGIVRNAKPQTFLIDMTTSSPSLAKKIEQKAKLYQCCTLDAPVSGGDVGAREARLSIMVGGEQDVFDAFKSVFEALGRNIVYQGQAGAGQHTKMCNQIAIASNMMGVCEALIYAKKAGLDQSVVLKSIESGAAGSWSLSNLAPRIINGDFEPGFFIKHFIKDMGIAIQAADEMGIETHGLKLAKSLYDQLQEAGYGNKGTQALYHIYK